MQDYCLDREKKFEEEFERPKKMLKNPRVQSAKLISQKALKSANYSLRKARGIIQNGRHPTSHKTQGNQTYFNNNSKQKSSSKGADEYPPYGNESKSQFSKATISSKLQINPKPNSQANTVSALSLTPVDQANNFIKERYTYQKASRPESAQTQVQKLSIFHPPSSSPKRKLLQSNPEKANLKALVNENMKLKSENLH